MNLKKSAGLLDALLPLARESFHCEAREVVVENDTHVTYANFGGACNLPLEAPVRVPAGKYTMIVALVPITKKD